MKRTITTLLTITMLAVAIPMLAASASAQQRTDGRYTDYYGYGQPTYQNEGYYDPYYEYEKPNVYERHRTVINLAVGTGVGALVGALIGGKKGALIGGVAGVAGGAIVTAKQKSKKTPRYSYYRN